MKSRNSVKKVLMIAYFFSENDGVGSLRSRSLYLFLKEKGIDCDVLTKESNKIFFYLKLFYFILFKRYDRVYLSCGPFPPLLVTSILSFISRKKLVVDFRDAWSLNILTHYGKNIENPFKGIKYYHSLMVEKISYYLSYKFVVCTKGMYLQYSKLFNDQKKLLLVENGFNFKPENIVRNDFGKNNFLRFICIGKFVEYDEKKARMILLSIKKQLKIEASFTFIGSSRDLNLPVIREYFENEDIIFIDRLPYKDVIIETKKHDVGLLIIRDENIDYGTKVFDYIGMGMPFFSVLEQNKVFFKEFNSYIIDLTTLKSKFSIKDVSEHHRNSKYEHFNGVLF
ncbi:hypothetical protein OHW21_15055 [Acinetobacter baumannii]|uniref:hypothetical protein n=1 Tax=Acinetobacter baumannii TaxID=470 RepID=UPI0003DF8B6F|nr:hypothetical protein [Acinetobacter baumannii]ETQ95717.1 hypothetical protein P673_1266 [Acinetobacter baumannii UH6507]MBU3082650.1 hypothetical protein [Acinetobacter baumannii]MDC5000756.1 hypothetical protein [Acinetobacter baumannii]MDC5036738.1 hypothetical protein [Acinetobacter baumannii]MDC5135893.1 hypothetical protein [Acinetobacter baumannii]